jgi:hypothetical protein
VHELQDNWAHLLSSAEFAYNNVTHESSKETSFYIEYGQHPRAEPSLLKEPQHVDMNNIMWNRQQAQEKAKAALELAAEQMKWYYNKNVQKVPFKVGDQVMLDLKDYQKSQCKFAAQRYGSFKIIEKLSPVTFKLEWPEWLQAIHPVFHASKLIPYHDAEFKG